MAPNFLFISSNCQILFFCADGMLLFLNRCVREDLQSSEKIHGFPHFLKFYVLHYNTNGGALQMDQVGTKHHKFENCHERKWIFIFHRPPTCHEDGTTVFRISKSFLESQEN